MRKKIMWTFITLLLLIIIVPAILYLNAIDLSNKHSNRVKSLPIFTESADDGEYRLPIGEMEFLIRVSGMQNRGPGMILLHGFPESSIMWGPLMNEASAKGYKVVAFDQRGYSPGARPKGVDSYQIDHLAEDVLAVADAVRFDTFHLVGHDWGSGVAWKTTMDHPDRIRTLTAMSVPHIGTFFNAFLTHPEQQKRSAYINRLRIPYLPEFIFLVNYKRFMKSVEGIWTPEELKLYKEIQIEHGAMTAMMNWYRAVDIEKISLTKEFEKNVNRPTLYIWGADDPVVAPEIIPGHKKFIKAPYTELRLECGHSLMQYKQEEVVAAIMKHVGTEDKTE